MAKVAFSKLNKVKNLPSNIFTLGEYEIEVKQYLPLEEKIHLIERIISQAGNEEEGFFNIVKLEVFYKIEMISSYTNIAFTNNQLDDIPKLYDAIVLNKIWESVEQAIPEVERTYIWDNMLVLAKEITTYNNSVLGILKTIKNGYNGTEFDVSNLKDEIEKLKETYLVKEIVPLLGLE